MLSNLQEILDQNFKLLIIIRGLPGRGKSTLARTIKTKVEECNFKALHCEADDYFTDSDGNYNWKKEELSQAHDFCSKRIGLGMKSGEYQVIIQSNTNSQFWESENVRGLAARFGFLVVFVSPKFGFTNPSSIPSEYQSHLISVHNVDEEKILEILGRKKNIWPFYFGYFVRGEQILNSFSNHHPKIKETLKRWVEEETSIISIQSENGEKGNEEEGDEEEEEKGDYDQKDEVEEMETNNDDVLSFEESIFHSTTDFVGRRANKSYDQSMLASLAGDCGRLLVDLQIVCIFMDSKRGVGMLVYSDFENEIENEEQEDSSSSLHLPTYYPPSLVGSNEGEEKWQMKHYRRVTMNDLDIPPHITLKALGQAIDIGHSAKELIEIASASNNRNFVDCLFQNVSTRALNERILDDNCSFCSLPASQTISKGCNYELLVFHSPLNLPALFGGYYGPSPTEFHKYSHFLWDLDMINDASSINDENLDCDEHKIQLVQKLENKILQQIIHHPSIKKISCKIPLGILPPSHQYDENESLMHDLSVQRMGGRGDDEIYESTELLRRCLPRGLTMLELIKTNGNNNVIRRVLNGLGKFTGHEDNDDNKNQKKKKRRNNYDEDDEMKLSDFIDGEESKIHDQTKLSKYFTEDISQTDYIIVTEKANGEAAHCSMIKIENESSGKNNEGEGKVYVIVGSKTSHMLLRLDEMEEDIEKYRNHPTHAERYRYAIRIAETLVSLLFGRLSEQSLNWFVSYLIETGYTACWELEDVHSCHIVPLYSTTLKFIAFAHYSPAIQSLNGRYGDMNGWVAVHPSKALGWMEAAGFDTIWSFKHRVEDNNDQDLAKEIMDESRFLFEGCVLYHMTSDENCIGLVKSKNAYYILLRALRQKVCF